MGLPPQRRPAPRQPIVSARFAIASATDHRQREINAARRRCACLDRAAIERSPSALNFLAQLGDSPVTEPARAIHLEPRGANPVLADRGISGAVAPRPARTRTSHDFSQMLLVFVGRRRATSPCGGVAGGGQFSCRRPHRTCIEAGSPVGSMTGRSPPPESVRPVIHAAALHSRRTGNGSCRLRSLAT